MVGALIFLLGMLGLFVLWAFFSFQPKFVNERQLSVFNWTVVGMCGMFCVGVSVYIFSDLSPEGRAEFFIPFTLAACLCVEIVFFTLGLLLRNFWIFSSRRPNKNSIFD
jgi:uncharacterized membrane protein YdcZ (DUF606 family)